MRAAGILTAGNVTYVDPTGNVEYTCMLINASPLSLQYKNLDDTTKAIKLVTPGNNIARVQISWQNTDATQTNFSCGSTQQFTTVAGWPCTTGLMRADLVPIPAGNFSWTSLDNAMLSAFFLPSSTTSDGSAPFYSLPYVGHNGYAASGVEWQVHCNAANTPKYCNASIDTGGSGTSYLLRLRSLYISSSAEITAYDSSNNQLPLTGAQVSIDVTGKANDILRREVVRVPAENPGPFPDFGIYSAESLCKQLVVNAAPPTITGSGNPGCDPTVAN